MNASIEQHRRTTYSRMLPKQQQRSKKKIHFLLYLSIYTIGSLTNNNNNYNKKCHHYFIEGAFLIAPTAVKVNLQTTMGRYFRSNKQQQQQQGSSNVNTGITVHDRTILSLLPPQHSESDIMTKGNVVETSKHQYYESTTTIIASSSRGTLTSEIKMKRKSDNRNQIRSISSQKRTTGSTRTTNLYSTSSSSSPTTTMTLVRPQSPSDKSVVSWLASYVQHSILPIVLFLTYSFIASMMVISWEDTICRYTLPSRHRTELLSLVPTSKPTVTPSLGDTHLKNHYPSEQWGQATVRGMGFGYDERQLILESHVQDVENKNDATLLFRRRSSTKLTNDASSDTTSFTTNTLMSNNVNDASFDNVLSYNEIMLHHRKSTIPQWRQAKETALLTIQQLSSSTSTTSTTNTIPPQTFTISKTKSRTAANDDTKLTVSRSPQVTVPDAIHTMILCYQSIMEMQSYASEYEWDEIHRTIQTGPLQDLSQAGAVLRHYTVEHNKLLLNQYQSTLRGTSGEDVIGFDWGSCSWRHCGAVADIQEAVDELQYLLGVLEPYEAIFCLDIAERSIRDILSILPWDDDATNTLLVYENDKKFYKEQIPSYVSKVHIMIENDDGTETDELSLIDQAYFKVLKEFKIEF